MPYHAPMPTRLQALAIIALVVVTAILSALAVRIVAHPRTVLGLCVDEHMKHKRFDNAKIAEKVCVTNSSSESSSTRTNWGNQFSGPDMSGNEFDGNDFSGPDPDMSDPVMSGPDMSDSDW